MVWNKQIVDLTETFLNFNQIRSNECSNLFLLLRLSIMAEISASHHLIAKFLPQWELYSKWISCLKSIFLKNLLDKINSSKNLQKRPFRTATNWWNLFGNFLDELILSSTFLKKTDFMSWCMTEWMVIRFIKYSCWLIGTTWTLFAIVSTNATWEFLLTRYQLSNLKEGPFSSITKGHYQTSSQTPRITS